MDLLVLLVTILVTSAIFGWSLEDFWEDNTLSSSTNENRTDAKFEESPSRTMAPKYDASDDDMLLHKETPEDTAFAKSSLDKIVGGTDAEYGEIPWQAFVMYNNGTRLFRYCGAVIIDHFWLLSAAHCYLNFKPHQLLVSVGEYNVQSEDMYEVTFGVAKIYNHQHYDDETTDNDVALLRIQPHFGGKGITYNRFVQPISLLSPTTSLQVGALLVVSGWGGMLKCLNCTNEPQEFPAVLKKTEVPTIGQDQCKQLYIDYTITDRMFCAGWLDGRTDSCVGDSGGPIVYKTADSSVLVGVVSWGRGCGQENSPGVYTRVSSFVAWILKTMKSHNPRYHRGVIETLLE